MAAEKKVFDLPDNVVAAIQDVYKIYTRGELETVALRGVSLGIREGEATAVVGPSGAGKSTLIGIIAGMLRPTAGSVYWSDSIGDISKLDPQKLVKVRRRFLGLVFQEGNLLPHLTALQNVELAARIDGLPEAKNRAKQLLERVGLGDRIRSVPGMLSSGERQRVAIASAIINNPKLILADEPTGNIDLARGEEILELFRELIEETGVSFLIVTHSQQVASRVKRILEIKDGVLVGLHGRGADMKDLDKSRILSLDDLQRIPIPSYILDQIGSPSSFQARIERGEIVLTPFVEDSSEVEVSATVCKVCGETVKDRKGTCPNCGSII
jgi:ABC-type lipoprotein export system ATPase subunit